MQLYNLVGGKIEQGEDGFIAAYRELKEETSITDIKLVHLMDFTYLLADSCYVEVYFGKINHHTDVYGMRKNWYGLTYMKIFSI